MSQFLSTELEFARTLIRIAESTNDSDKETRCIFNARKAYDAVEESLPRTPISDSEKEQIRDSLSWLESRLKALGQNFDGLGPVLTQGRRPHSTVPKIRRSSRRPVRSANPYGDVVRDVKRFLIECQQLNAESEHLRAQNKAIMERKRGVIRHVS